MSTSAGAEVRARLTHPVIDADGHWLELQPVFLDYVRDVAGPRILEAYLKGSGRNYGRRWYEATPEARRGERIRRPGWWLLPTNARDRAAAMIPRLFRAQLDEWGIDLALVYPTFGFTLPGIEDEEMRRALVRSYNAMAADLFRPYADRIIPAAVVCLNTPQEALDELENVRALGMKLVMMNGTIKRYVQADAAWQPDERKRRVYIDCLAMDSPYDYDCVWQKCVDLGLAVSNHTGSLGWPDRSSPSNFVADHLGHFAQSHHYFARGLLLGGVTQRFPQLNFAFLEGGAGWACNLYADLAGHWEKRNKTFMHERLKPTNIDRKAVRALFEQYATDGAFRGKIDAILAANLECVEPDRTLEELAARDLDRDEFSAIRVQSAAGLGRLFSRNFYFGCEADDITVSWAFDKRLGAELKPLFGSDISHFDVIDASTVLHEAWELVERGLIDEDNFQAFTFSNAVRLHGGMNGGFFRGTAVEREASKVLAPHSGASPSSTGSSS